MRRTTSSRHKALPGTKKKEPANMPNEFVTNDDFCPGCGLELKSLPADEMQLWTDVFQRDLEDGFDAVDRRRRQARTAGVPRLGTRAAAERRPPRACRGAARRHRGDGEGAAAEVSPTCTASGRREAGRTCSSPSAATRCNLGDEVPRRFLTVLSAGEPRRSRRAAAGSSWPTPSPRIRSPLRVIVNRIWKGHFGTGLVDTPSNFGANGERPTQPGAARVPRATFRRRRAVDQEAAPRDHAECGVPAQRRTTCRRTSRRTPAIASTGTRAGGG